MTYIPVGTVLNYTAQISQGYVAFTGYSNPTDLIAQLKNDLPNLQGMEELDLTSSNSTNNFLGLGKFGISLEILNNGVDHGSETDIESIINGVIQGYGNNVVSSNIIVKSLPDNPTDAQNNEITISNPKVTPNAPSPTTPSNTGSIFSGFNLSGASIAGISITTIIIVLIIAVLLLPKNARRLVGG